jgi:ribonuclease HI
MVLDEAYMLRKCEDEALTDSQEEKQVVNVKFDDQSSPMDKSNDEQFFKDSQHQKETYSLAKGKEKRDWKTLEMYKFENMFSFALVVGNKDSSCVQDAITWKKKIRVGCDYAKRGGVITKKNWCRIRELIELSKENKAIGYTW